MRPFFQQLNILYLALLAGQLLFCGVAYFLIYNNMTDHQPPDDALFKTLVPLFILGGAGAAYFLNRRRQVQGGELDSLEAKAQHYRSSVIIRSALMEGANLFAIVAGLLQQDLLYLLYFAVGVLAFVYFRPSKQNFIREYELSGREIEELEL